jgi:hypothetical protein
MLMKNWPFPLLVAPIVANTVLFGMPLPNQAAIPVPLATDLHGQATPSTAPSTRVITQNIVPRDPLIPVEDEDDPTLDGLDQVTSVSQLTDVKPTDWAFQALRSLVERYGCIVGYPDKTYRGTRSLTRYEFAAGLNACLDKIQELIASATADFVRKEDLEVLKKLQDSFASELVLLRARVDALEARTANIREQQFSTTTKLTGNVIFSVADIFGADGGSKNQAVFQSRANLNLNTSFTGYDLLFLSLYAGNVPAFPLGGFRLPTTTTGGLPVNSAEGALDVVFGGNTNNQLQLLGAGYVFPISPQAQVFVVGANTALFALIPTVNPFLDDKGIGTGALSLFAQRNAIYALGAAGAGAGINF